MTALQQFSLIILFLSSGQLILAQNLYEASLLEKEGKIEQAVQIYDEWLASNSKDSRFSEVLIHCSSLISSVDDTLRLLMKYENFADNENKQDVYLKIAQTHELVFQYEKAAYYYEKASINSDGIRNYKIYLKYLLLNYQLGEIPLMSDLNDILLGSEGTQIHVDALLLKAELYKYEGNLNRAETLLQESRYSAFFPEIQLFLWEIHLLRNNLNAASQVLDLMKTNFPDSIELSLMEGKVGALPRLSHFFLPSQSSPFQSYVQVGSF